MARRKLVKFGELKYKDRFYYTPLNETKECLYIKMNKNKFLELSGYSEYLSSWDDLGFRIGDQSLSMTGFYDHTEVFLEEKEVKISDLPIYAAFIYLGKNYVIIKKCYNVYEALCLELDKNLKCNKVKFFTFGLLVEPL